MEYPDREGLIARNLHDASRDDRENAERTCPGHGSDIVNGHCPDCILENGDALDAWLSTTI